MVLFAAALFALFVLLVWAVAWLSGRWGPWQTARSRRTAMGAIAVDALPDGAVATIEGELDARHAVESLDDGRSVALCAIDVDDVPRRASGVCLALVRGDATIALDGPYKILVGSAETYAGVEVSELSDGARQRVLARDSEPPAGVLTFRSLRSGDRVRARGRVIHASTAPDGGYRDPAVATIRLVPPGEKPGRECVELAYAGRPRVRRAFAAILNGVRLAPPRLFAAGLLLSAGTVVGIAVAIVKPAASVEIAAAPAKLNSAECKGVEKTYEEAVYAARACTNSAECVAQPRGRELYELDGCVRFVNPSHPRLVQADRLADDWLYGGCASEIELCPPLPGVQCVNGACVDLPPAPLPSTWQRVQEEGAFWFYVPPDVVYQRVRGTDSLVGHGESERLEIDLDFGWYSDPLIYDEAGGGEARNREEGDIIERVTVDGVAARIVRAHRLRGYNDEVLERPFEVHIHFMVVPLCGNPWCSPSGSQPVRLTVYTRSRTEEAAEEAERALRSIRFMRLAEESSPSLRPSP